MAFDPYYQWLSIPPEEQPPNHYRLLGVRDFESSLNVIENAADRQMLHVRTFQSGDHSEESQQLLNQISQARICLLEPKSKASYDASLRKEIRSNEEPDASSEPEHPPTINHAKELKVSTSSATLFTVAALTTLAVVLIVVGFGLLQESQVEEDHGDPDNAGTAKQIHPPTRSDEPIQKKVTLSTDAQDETDRKARPTSTWTRRAFVPSDVADLPDASIIDGGVALSANQHFFFPEYQDNRNIAVRAHVRLVEGKRCSLFVRVSLGGNYYVLSYLGKNRFQIAKSVLGTFTVLDERIVHIQTDSVLMQLAAHEGTLTAWINGGIIFQLQDGSLTSGQVVLSAFQAQAEFTEVQVRSTDGERPPQRVQLAKNEWTTYEFTRDRLARIPQGASLIENGVRLSNSNVAQFIFHELKGANLSIEANVHFIEGRNLSINPLVDGPNFYAVIYRGQGQFQFNFNQGGKGIVLARAKVDAIQDESFRLRAERLHDTYVISVDGTEIMRVRDDRLSNGAPAIATYRGTSEFRNVRFQMSSAP